MQITHFVPAFLALVASCAALQLTNPAQGSSLDLTKDNKITWNSVPTDPTSFDIFLVNQNVNPPVSTTIASGVKTSSGSYDLSSLSNVTPGSGYQFNLVSADPQNSGILAQTGQITVAEEGASTTSALFSSTGTSSTGSSTSTGSSSVTSTTVTTTSTSTTSGSTTMSTSASSSGSARSSASRASSASPSASPSPTNAALTLNTFAGAGVLAMVAALFA